MENLYEIKEHLAKLGRLVETSEMENKNIVLFKKKIEELEKTLEQNKYINIMSKKMIVLNNFNFIGYHKTELLPVYRYVGDNFEKDSKNIFCEYSEIEVKTKDLVRTTSKLFQIDSNYQVKLRETLLKFDKDNKQKEQNELKLIKSDAPKEKTRVLKISFDDETEFFNIIKPLIDNSLPSLNPKYSCINNYTTNEITPENFGVIEFIGYSRIDGFPIIRIFEKTFNETTPMKSQIHNLFNIDIKDKFNLQVVYAIDDHIKK